MPHKTGQQPPSAERGEINRRLQTSGVMENSLDVDSMSEVCKQPPSFRKISLISELSHSNIP